MIYAAGQNKADEYLGALLRVLKPGAPPLFAGAIAWQQATKQQQPVGPAWRSGHNKLSSFLGGPSPGLGHAWRLTDQGFAEVASRVGQDNHP